MKTIIYLAIIGISLNACAQTEPLKHDWNVILKVVDETAQPVAGAKAGVGNSIAKFEMSGLTDTNGVFVASHRDAIENLAFYAEKPGYYSFHMTYHKGDYNPERWNSTQTVILKRIIKPIPMYAKSVNLAMPVFDKPVGFDFELGDWVGPYGKGISSDIIFTAHFDKRSRLDFDYKLNVSFPKPGDGIQVFNAPTYYLNSHGSALRSNKEAPEGDYQSEIVREHNERPDKILKYDNDPERIYIFRVRTKVDDNGNIVSAHYGKIYGDFMQFKYYFNPTPNSRNIEFDPKQNLVTDLKFNEGVSEP